MKKTKIICSIGPSSQDVETMTKMVENGMNVARVNFSHGNYEEYSAILDVVKKTREVTHNNIAVLYDTKGPDFRILDIVEEGIKLEPGGIVRIVKQNIIGRDYYFSVNHPEILDRVEVGNSVLLEDALMRLEVINKDQDGLVCKVIEGGILYSRKGINIPGVKLDIPFLSEQDKKDIEFACNNQGDFIALSFVESADNIKEVKELLKQYNREDMKIISKVESEMGVNNLEEIIDESDGIMVARGDLGVEVDLKKLPIIQKDMIRLCREKEKFVIVATEMLASMYESPRPTRAEVTDISNAVLDGADAVMLSGESTVGKHPVEAVKYMANICEETEKNSIYATKFMHDSNSDITEAIASSVIESSSALNIKAIVVPTTGGHSATVISNLRPKTIVLALCPSEKVARSLSLNYGVYPVVSLLVKDDDMDDTVENAKNIAIEELNLTEGDIIIITGGIHHKKEVKQTNFMKIEEI